MKLLRSLARLTAVALAVALAVAMFQPSVATAHSGQGRFAVETEEPTPEGERFVVRLTWVNDNHPAIDATVTATPIDPAGTAGTPVALTVVDQDGRYQGAVPLATRGTWTVRFTSVTPAATTEVTREVSGPTTTSAPATTEPADRPITTESTAPGSSTDGGTDSGSAGTIVFVAVVAALALVGVLAYRSARHRRAP